MLWKKNQKVEKNNLEITETLFKFVVESMFNHLRR